MKFYETMDEIRADRAAILEKLSTDITDETMGAVIEQALDYYMSAVMAVLNPMRKIETPFLMVVLRSIVEVMESENKDMVPMAKVIELLTTSESTTVTVERAK